MIVPYDLLLAAQKHGPAVQHHPGHDRLDLAAGRRHRHHEHHAGDRHRAHPRDRHPPRPGRQAAGHHPAVPDRDRRALGRRRPARRRRRDSSSRMLIVFFIPDQKAIVTGGSVVLAFGISVADRHPLRPLPRPPRGHDGPDRGAAARIAPLAELSVFGFQFSVKNRISWSRNRSEARQEDPSRMVTPLAERVDRRGGNKREPSPQRSVLAGVTGSSRGIESPVADLRDRPFPRPG